MYKIKEIVKTHILLNDPELIEHFEQNMKNRDFLFFNYDSRNYNPFYSPYTPENPDYYLNKHFDKSLFDKNITKYNFDTIDVKWCEKYILWISRHPYPVSMLEKNPDDLGDVDWYLLSSNPYAIRLLEENPDKIHWYSLSLNPAALKIMARYPRNVYFFNLMENPAVYELDYEALKLRMDIFREELIARAIHPKRVQRLIEMAGDEFFEMI